MSVLKKFRKAAQNTGQHGGTTKLQRASTPPAELQSGYRYDEHGNSYWLTGKEMAELAALNAAIEDDDEFWQAFADLRDKYGIKPSVFSSSATQRGSFSGKSSYSSGGSWKDPTKGKSFMSEWWSGFKGWTTGKGENETKLAVMRRAIEVTLSVVDDGNKLHMKYSDDTDQPVSYTDMRSNLVVVSAKPVHDRLPDGEALDIMSGFSMHEASHSKHTRTLLGELEKPEPLRPYAVAGLMANLVEDYRIEALTSEEFPGFAGYFTAALDYMWKEGEKAAKTTDPKTGKPKGWPTEYGPDLVTKMNAAIGIVKWEKDFRAKVSGKQWDAEFEWWTQWRDNYNAGKTTLRQATELALSHLRAATEEESAEGKGKEDARADSGESAGASDEMDQQEAKEKAAEAAGAALADAIRKFLEENGVKDFCTHRDHDATHKVSAGANEAIGQLIDDDVEFVKPPKRPGQHGVPPPVIITKPKETAYSKRYYSNEPDAMAAKYRAALVFRPDKEIHSTKLLKRGKVDGTQLYRWAVDDWRMFMEKGRKVDPSAYVYLLVDLSGSMGGEKLRAAQRMAKLFIQALSSMDGVTPKVFGHTGDTTQTASDVFRIWEPGDPMSRNGLIMSLPHSNNYDGYAIEWVGNRLAAESRNGEQRLLIVLSDGYPAGSGYGGSSAEQHVHDVVQELRTKHRIRTLQIAIDTSLDGARQARMFDEFIPYRPGDSLDSVPRRLTQWLEKAL